MVAAWPRCAPSGRPRWSASRSRRIRELLAAGPDLALAIIGTAVGRLRGMESLLREREKLAGLGTLAAGLAHELNNPAAAALRSVRSLEQAVSHAEELPRPAPAAAATGRHVAAAFGARARRPDR